LIDDLTEAAKEAIEQAAGEAAKAATLAMLEQQAVIAGLALKWEIEYKTLKSVSKKNIIISGLIGFVSGAAVSGLIIILGR
jgi:hypothetical protein